MIIDKYKTKAAFIDPIERKEKEQQHDDLDWKWIDERVHFGHFHLSILKCKDVNCCGDLQSNVHDILQLDAYPGPGFYVRIEGVIRPPNVHYSSLPELLALQRGFLRGAEEGDAHDDYNALYNNLSLAQTQCRVCSKCFPSQKTMLLHRRA